VMFEAVPVTGDRVNETESAEEGPATLRLRAGQSTSTEGAAD
jgi:hypothetical protein